MESKAFLRLQQMNRSPLNVTQTPPSTSSVNIAGFPQRHLPSSGDTSPAEMDLVQAKSVNDLHEHMLTAYTSVTETMYDTLSDRAFSGLRNCFQVLYVISAVLLK